MPEPITSDVPIPGAPPSRARRFPVQTMAVGDSFIVPRSSSGVHTAIRRQKLRQPGQEFTTRIIGDQIRVWRIA